MKRAWLWWSWNLLHSNLHMRGTGKNVAYCPRNVLKYSIDQCLCVNHIILRTTSDWRQGTLLWMAATLSGLSGYMAAWNSVWTKPEITTIMKSVIVFSSLLTWRYSAHTNVAPDISELLSPSLQEASHSKLGGCVKPKFLLLTTCHDVLVICLVEGFGGTLCPDIDPIMIICPSSILLETIDSTLSWVHRHRAGVI